MSRQRSAFNFEHCSGPLHFMKQWIPCALNKFLNFLTDTDNIVDEESTVEEKRNVTIQDVTKHNPGPFNQTGFTYITFPEVEIFQSVSSATDKYVSRIQKLRIGDWEATTFICLLKNWSLT